MFTIANKLRTLVAIGAVGAALISAGTASAFPSTSVTSVLAKTTAPPVTTAALSPTSVAVEDTATATVGQTGTPIAAWAGTPGDGLPGLEVVQTTPVVSTAGTVTSLNTQSSSCNAYGASAGVYNLQVLQPLAENQDGRPQYRVLGDTGNHADPCDGALHSYPVNIPVQAGDLLGVYVADAWQGVLSLNCEGSGSGCPAVGYITEPGAGETITTPFYSSGLTDESATLKRLLTFAR